MRLINADSLVERYGDWYTEEGPEEGFIGTVKDLVDLMPSIDSDKKFGRWISRWEDGQNYYECDQCGHETGLCNDYNYCPSCGARMDDGIRWI